MRSRIAKLVLLLLAVVLVPRLMTLTRAIEQGLPEDQQCTLDNCSQVGKWATSVREGAGRHRDPQDLSLGQSRRYS